MDIASASMNMSQITLQSQVSTAVLDKAMDTNEALADGLIQMMDAAAMERTVNPAVGGNLDLKI